MSDAIHGSFRWYLMVVGVIFTLAQHFPGFSALRVFMIEHHAIGAYFMIFDTAARGRHAFHIFWAPEFADDPSFPVAVCCGIGMEAAWLEACVSEMAENV